MIPGMYPRSVRRMLMARWTEHPVSKKTPTGGRMIAQRIFGQSVQVNGILGRASDGEFYNYLGG